jgi:DNA-binding response OmpR family regulator
MTTELHEAGRGAAVKTGSGSTFQLGLKLGPEIMQLALTEAMSADQSVVAATALQVLAQTGSARLLKSVEGRPAPVVAALSHPDPRVQSAAAATILIWDPQTSFRGASRVVEVLTRNLLDTGKARGIAIDANEQRATSMSAALQEMGFEADMAQTGQDGFKRAIGRGDVALFLIEANVARWDLSQTLANLRADARTAYIPIVIYGDDSLRTRVERAASAYARVQFVTQVSSGEDMKRQVAPFLKRWQAESLTQPQRTALRKSAMFWLTQLADRRQASLFDLSAAENALFNAVNDAELAESAVFSLGAIATPSAQAKLFEIATTATRSVAVRERALAQLTAHLQHHGMLLTETQTAELHKAARQETDPKLQSAFAATLGSLNPDLRQANELLKAVPARRTK